MSKPKLGFSTGAAHAHLGRFRREGVLRAGHNTYPQDVIERMTPEQRKRLIDAPTVSDTNPSPDEGSMFPQARERDKVHGLSGAIVPGTLDKNAIDTELSRPEYQYRRARGKGKKEI